MGDGNCPTKNAVFEKQGTKYIRDIAKVCAQSTPDPHDDAYHHDCGDDDDGKCHHDHHGHGENGEDNGENDGSGD